MSQTNNLQTRIARIRALATTPKHRDQVITELTSLVDALQQEIKELEIKHDHRIARLEAESGKPR